MSIDAIAQLLAAPLETGQTLAQLVRFELPPRPTPTAAAWHEDPRREFLANDGCACGTPSVMSALRGRSGFYPGELIHRRDCTRRMTPSATSVAGARDDLARAEIIARVLAAALVPWEDQTSPSVRSYAAQRDNVSVVCWHIVESWSRFAVDLFDETCFDWTADFESPTGEAFREALEYLYETSFPPGEDFDGVVGRLPELGPAAADPRMLDELARLYLGAQLSSQARRSGRHLPGPCPFAAALELAALGCRFGGYASRDGIDAMMLGWVIR